MCEYEIDKDGSKQLVKSIDMNERSFIRFTNQTRRPVDVYWLNYMGRPEKYKQLLPRQYFDVNTYTTHPWMFKDSVTQERYVVNNQLYFRGPSNVRYTPNDPNRRDTYIVRVNWNITAPMRTLKTAALITLAEYIENQDDLTSLDLPKCLVNELSEMIALYRTR